MKAFRASAKDCGCTAPTPKEAAVKFFETFPSRRKCHVMEGESEGGFFSIRFGRTSEGDWPKSYPDVTRKSAQELPGNDTGEPV